MKVMLSFIVPGMSMSSFSTKESMAWLLACSYSCHVDIHVGRKKV
jgi:hypothetical protein